MIEDLLHWLGVRGQIVSAVVVLYALYHLRDAMLLVSRITTTLWIGLVAIGVFLAVLIVLPGIDVVVQLQTAIDALWDIVAGAIEIATNGASLALRRVL